MPVYDTPFGNILFIHVPKTGGSTIEEHLASHSSPFTKREIIDRSVPCSPQHYHGAVLERTLREVPLRYAFMIVRHPVDRVVSEFKFQTRKPWKFYRRVSFSYWLQYHLKRATQRPYHRDNHFRPQHEFSIPGTEVFRFEDGLTPCFTRLQSVAGIAPPKEEIHLKRSRPVRIKPGKLDIELIANFYKADFDRYGYRIGCGEDAG